LSTIKWEEVYQIWALENFLPPARAR